MYFIINTCCMILILSNDFAVFIYVIIVNRMMNKICMQINSLISLPVYG